MNLKKQLAGRDKNKEKQELVRDICSFNLHFCTQALTADGKSDAIT